MAGAALRGKPLLVPLLIAVNVVMFALTAWLAGSVPQNYNAGVFTDLALWPVPVAAGEWWRLFTSGFLHMGLLHLAMNMIALWVVGQNMELLLGRLRFAAVYFLSLLGGSAAVFLFGGLNSLNAGASGAVYGLMGGLAVAAFRLKISLRPVLTVIAINIVISFLPGLSLLGHLGGLVTGVALTAGMVYAPRERRTLIQVGVVVVVLLVLLTGLIARDLQLGPVICIGSGAETRCASA